MTLCKALLLSLLWLPIAFAAGTAAPPVGATRGRATQPTSPATTEERSATDREPVHPGVLLLRDPLVQRDLQLSDRQVAGATQLAAEFNDEVWKFRDADIESAVAQREARALNERLVPRLRELLAPRQFDRLTGISLQTQGTTGLSFTSTARLLDLTRDQQERIARLNSIARAAISKLQQDSAGQADSQRRRRDIASRQQQLQHDLQEVLTPTQRKRWTELTGAPVDLARLQPLAAQAPELRDVTTWINSEPLQLSELRGKVVVLHFWTFGCINCIHNYPAYKNWSRKFRGQEVVLIGVHTPETPGEKDLDQIRRKANQNGLDFAIAVDNEQRNWQAWSNGVWPAVYLIDRRGLVRYWWYGELNWQGADGEEFLAERITELLREH